MNKCPCEPKEPKCAKVDGITIVVIPESLGDDSQGSTYAPEIGAYTNTVVKYLANGYVYIYDKKGNYTMVADSDVVDIAVDKKLDIKSTNAVENRVITAAINELTTGLKDEIQARKDADDEIISDLSELDKSLAKVAKTGEYSDLLNKPVIDVNLSTTSKNSVENRAVTNALNTEKDARIAADNALRTSVNSIDTNLNKTVVTDIDLGTTSATAVNLDSTKTNLKTSATSVDTVPLPIASATQAGVMTSATYNAVQQNANDINALLNGSCAVDNLPANPTQQELTDAWKAGTGLDEPINRSLIYDSSNNKLWTYYLGVDTWYATSASVSVDVQQFTNSSLGTIKGSTVTGQVYAEANGTGTVNGWDALSADVSSAKSKLSTIESGAEANVQADWTQTDTTADDYIKNKPTLSTVATSGDYNDLTNKPIDSNTNVGSGVNPVYVKDGEVKASASNVGNTRKPVYMKDGSITATDATVGASDTPIYMSNGTLMAGGKLSKVATSGDFNDLINKPTEVDVDTTKLEKLVPYDTDTELHTGDDLNSFLFRQVGTYYCVLDSTAQAILNSPTERAFRLETSLENDITPNDEIETASWIYLLQTVTDIDGNVFSRNIVKNSQTSGGFAYGDWKKVATIDPADDLDLSKLAYVSDEVPSGYVPVFGTQSIEDGAITTAKLDSNAVTRDKIDWSSFGQTDEALIGWDTRLVTPSIVHGGSGISQKEGWGPSQHDDTNKTLVIDGVSYTNKNTRIHGFWCGSDGVDANGCVVFDEIGVVTYSEVGKLQGRMVKRYRHGSFSSGNNGQNWVSINDRNRTVARTVNTAPEGKTKFTINVATTAWLRTYIRLHYQSNNSTQYATYEIVVENNGSGSMSKCEPTKLTGTDLAYTVGTNSITFAPSNSGAVPYGYVYLEYPGGYEDSFSVSFS